MRIHQLAKKIGINSKDLIEKLKQLNFPVKSHMSVVDEETADIIIHEIKDLQKKEIAANVVRVDFPITVRELAIKLGLKPSQVVADFLREGKFLNINSRLDEETACRFAYKYKITLKRKPEVEERILTAKTNDIRPRPPIVTLMGHIDHGKTSLLDYIRRSKITQKEAGGITQHIGAYQVKLKDGYITFLDTPGHETFTQMRARGANITDIIILVVAADDGVKPQTVEAIDHAKAAGVPIIVGINKIDKPTANPDMVKQELSRLALTPEDWGGKTTTVNISAKTGQGVDELLELILLQANIMELKADYGKPAVAVVVEAHLSKGKGPVADVLVKEGILKKGDWCVCGLYYGRIKSLCDEHNNFLDEVYPSMPAEVLGLGGVPSPGDKLFVVPDEKSARSIVERRREEEQKKKLTPPSHLKLEDLYKKIKEGSLKQLKVIVKADVGGTLEAVTSAITKIPSKEVEVSIVHQGVGSINNSDILLAEVTDAIVVGFKTTLEPSARGLAKEKGIEVRIYQVIYELINDIKGAIEGMLTPQIKKIFLGRARVKAVFKLSKSGVIAGCFVEKGKILRGANCEVVRDNATVYKGKIVSLKRFKNDAREVGEGYECGVSVGYDDIKEGDIIDVFTEEKITRKL